jgi:CTP synthase
MRFDCRDRTLYLHLTLLPYLGTSEEYKTKPTQHSVATLRGVGIQPDGIILRSKSPVPDEARHKIALFTNVEARDVFNSYDADFVYAVPEILEQQGIGRFIERRLQLKQVTPELRGWQEAVRILREPDYRVAIGIVGKYVAMPDAYLSLIEALRHAGIANRAEVRLEWINAEALVEGQLALLTALDGILVPGGFGIRGIEGKVLAARYAREQQVPFLGLCLGMQVAVIEYARHQAGLEGANSTEFDPYTPYPVIDLMPEQLDTVDLGGTMRLGNWPLQISPNTVLAKVYGSAATHGLVLERHRHRYEVNPAFADALQAAGLIISGTTPGMRGRGAGLIEAIELSDHPFFLGVQSHPEFASRLMRPSPPLRSFIEAAVAHHRQLPT